ncbi:NAD(P)-dependent dehydrogenase (short-subunit alcohol dehydrogenase family) [Sphingomonas prati]|uniref:NAD(P)-dependent dehydrogenase (Short-subunit alcohol dehydrogenase family) n=2 Tax=Sphingomonas prati TaxID=1843237 RepID=A0A7W9BS83_9SPHN|nr:SDR family oxidoreductase [Sphingomonas prati]MBB5729041.1 NAD(P)-dependent dehydrogenase (short-subunit alcohol dehydrogenase family) [Sphingomonas prati]
MDEVHGKVALVTGGNRGIGKEIALALARAGTDVAITYRSNEEEALSVLEDIRRMGRRSAALRLDLNQLADLDGFIDAFGWLLARDFGGRQLDYLVNNAGFGKAIPIEKLTFADFDTFNDVHFKGVVFLTQKVLAMMRDNGGVVFITAAGDRYNVPGYAAYAACKGAIEVFSRYVAKEYGARGIRSNSVAPGGIVTDFNNAAIRSNAQAQAYIIGQTPMGRLGHADDIGDVAAFLCSDAARWMTGQRLEVTGGFNL